MLEDEDIKPEVVDDKPETEEVDAPSDVTVDLNPPKKADEPAKPADKSHEDLTRLHNTIAYQTRKLEQAMREIQQMRN